MGNEVFKVVDAKTEEDLTRNILLQIILEEEAVVAIYSTFLQRAYDQLIHDVALQDLPVLFALDRA